MHLSKSPPRRANSIAPCCLFGIKISFLNVAKLKTIKNCCPWSAYIRLKLGFPNFQHSGSVRWDCSYLIQHHFLKLFELMQWQLSGKLLEIILLYENKHDYNREWDIFYFLFKINLDLSKNFKTFTLTCGKGTMLWILPGYMSAPLFFHWRLLNGNAWELVTESPVFLTVSVSLIHIHTALPDPHPGVCISCIITSASAAPSPSVMFAESIAHLDDISWRSFNCKKKYICCNVFPFTINTVLLCPWPKEKSCIFLNVRAALMNRRKSLRKILLASIRQNASV